MRPETGPMRFGDDWTGVFIRGDTAAWYALKLQEAAALAEDDTAFDDVTHILRDFAQLLSGSNETLCEKQREIKDLQQMKEHDECVQS